MSMSTSGGPPNPRPQHRPKPAQPFVPPTVADDDTEPNTPSVLTPNPKNTKKTSGRGGSSSRPTTKIPVGTGEAPGWWERIVLGSIGSGQLAVFCRQLAAYLNAGLAVSQAFASLQVQFASTALGPVCGRLLAAVKRGEDLTAAMSREPQAFDPLFLSMIRVAEARGGIPETLRLLGKHYEGRQRLIRQARSAMIYPIVVLLMASAVATFLTVWLLPMMAGMLRDLMGQGATLPLPSRMLIGFSDFVRSIGWLVIPVVAVVTPILGFRFYRTPAGKQMMDRAALRFPVFGGLLRKLDMSRFARALASLLDAGVDAGSSIGLASEIVRLDPYRKALKKTQTMVLNGSELSEALGATGRFTPDVLAVISSGEESGKLPESLNHLADDYEEQVEYTVKNLGYLVQPMLYIVMGGIVLFIILAVFLPYLSMLTNLSRP